jgi:hypothetical protein
VLDCRGLILFAPLVRKNGLESLVLWNPAIRMSMTLSQPPCKFDGTTQPTENPLLMGLVLIIQVMITRC